MLTRKTIGAGLIAAALMGAGQGAPVWRATVLAGESGAPLAGISFHDAEGVLLALSDANGRVTFSAPARARLALGGSGRIGVPLTLHGSPHDLGVLTLERSVTLRGKLLNPDGGPAGGQEIWLVSSYIKSRHLDDPGRAGHLYQIKVTTQVDGAFQFEGFWVEEYGGGTLLVGAGGQIIRRFEAIPRQSVDIGPVRLRSLAVAVGQVVGADGDPVAGARVALGPFDTGPSLDEDVQRILWQVAVTDVRGTYTLELAPGVYRAVALGGEEMRRQGFEVFEGAEPSVLPTIHLTAAHTIGGRLVDGGGAALAGAHIAIRHLPSTLRDELTPPRATETDGAGCWSLANVRESYVQVVAGRGDELTRVGHETINDSWSCAEAEASIVGRGGRGRVNVVVNAECEFARQCHIAWQSLEKDDATSTWVDGDDTGAHGTRDLTPGDWVVRASAPGYIARERQIHVAAGDEFAVTFDLKRVSAATNLQVLVLGPARLPAGLTEVRLSPSDSHNDVRLEPVATDAGGTANFLAVPPGRYHLSASRFGSAERTSRQITLPSDGPAVELALTMRDQGGARISGQVLDSSGTPVGGAVVIALEEGNGATGGSTLSAADGAYEISLPPPGHRLPAQGYRLSAYVPNVGLALAPEPIRLVDGVSTEQTLILGRGADVDGSFALAGEPDGAFNFYGPYMLPRPYVPAWSTRTGTYHVRGLPPGDWTFSAGAHGAGNEVRFVVSVDADMTVHAPTPVLEFPPTYRVSGQVLMHGLPLTGVFVFSSPLSAWSASVETDADGHYDLVARGGTEELYVRLTAPFAYEIRPLEGDREIEITVHGATVDGRVVHKSTGAPIRTAELFLRRAKFIGWTDSFRDFYGVDGNGRFDFGTLPAGHWTVQIGADGYTQEIVGLDLRDDPEDLLVELEPTTGLRVRATDTTGNIVGRVSFAIQRSGENARLHTNRDRAQDEVWWPSAPLGPALLTVVARYKDLYFRGKIDNTGEPLDIILQPAGRLEIYVPEDLLPDESDTWYRPDGLWTAQLVGDDGLAVPARDYHHITTLLELRYGDPDIRVRAIPPGEYRLEVTGPDGFAWTTRVAIRAGEQARVQVPGR